MKKVGTDLRAVRVNERPMGIIMQCLETAP